jgi:proline iminopeptidase
MIQNDLWTRPSKNRCIVFYDQRGTGKSSRLKPGASQTIDAQLADLESVPKKLGFQKFDLVGHSYDSAAPDMNVAPLTAWNIYRAIPGAKFVVFEKSGHLPSYEEPDKYFHVVNEFLSGR